MASFGTFQKHLGHQYFSRSFLLRTLRALHKAEKRPMTDTTTNTDESCSFERPVELMAPRRVQLSRSKGWRMPPKTVKVDSSTRWGNPYKLYTDGYPMTPLKAVESFSRLLAEKCGWVMRDQLTTAFDVQRELAGKNLACWCSLDKPCHADVLLRLANHERPSTQ